MKVSSIIDHREAWVVEELLRPYVVIVDSGHGWGTPGKQSPDGSLRENHFNTAVENKLTYLLDRTNVKFEQTAPEWWDITLGERVKKEATFYDEHTAKGFKVIGVSIHANAFKKPAPRGIETFLCPGSVEGKKLAKYVHKAIIDTNTKNNTIPENRGIKEYPFYILKRTKAPWILVELGFMTNPYNLKHLKSDSYRNDCAEAILSGIATYAMAKKTEELDAERS